MQTPHWSFPPFQPGYQTADPVQNEFFLTESIGGLAQTLVREAIQNALDARAGDEPVLIRFAWVTVAAVDYQIYFSNLQPHLEAVANGLIKVPEFSQPMQFLVIEDFNTTGLRGDPEREYIEKAEDKQEFYYFWRNVGRTGKRESNRGRWGLGKAVFSTTSTLATFFGITCRASDGDRLLMGQSVLKHHTIGQKHYTPYGYFGRFDRHNERETNFAHPLDVNDQEWIEHFGKTFKLLRNDRPGLSLVLAAPNPELSPSAILRAAMFQYFYPILTHDLALRIDDLGEIIHNGNFRDALSKHLSVPNDYQDNESQRFDKEAFLHLLDFAQWSVNLPASDFIELNEPDRKRAPDWRTYLTDEQIEKARAQFIWNSRIAFRVGMKVEVEEDGKKSVKIGWFKVFIQRDETLSRAESHFIRNGIRLVGIKGHSLRGIRGIVVIDDDALGQLLGDAENPAHTEWQKDIPGFKKYVHGPSSLSFVKNSLTFLAGKLTEVSKEIDRELLTDIFFIEEPPNIPAPPREGGVDQKKTGDGPTDFVSPDLASNPPPIASRMILNGVEIYSVAEIDAPISQVAVHFAYEVRTGNPFSKYHPFDFDLADNNEMQIETEGAEITLRAGNELQCHIVKLPFRIRVIGFDGVRDVAIRINWEKDEHDPAL